MKKSINTLRIVSIRGLIKSNFIGERIFESTMRISLESFCPVIRKTYQRFLFETTVEKRSEEECLKAVIENFFNKKCQLLDSAISSESPKSDFNLTVIDEIDLSSLPDNIQNIFRQIISNTNINLKGLIER